MGHSLRCSPTCGWRCSSKHAVIVTYGSWNLRVLYSHLQVNFENIYTSRAKSSSITPEHTQNYKNFENMPRGESHKKKNFQIGRLYMLPFVIKYKLKSRIFYTHIMHTLLPLMIITFKSHYVRISCLTIRKKILPQLDFAILQPNGIDRVTITVRYPRDTTYAQRVLSDGCKVCGQDSLTRMFR